MYQRIEYLIFTTIYIYIYGYIFMIYILHRYMICVISYDIQNIICHLWYMIKIHDVQYVIPIMLYMIHDDTYYLIDNTFHTICDI